MNPLVVRPAEAATLLGIGRSKIYELLASGALPSVRIGKSIRIPVDALQRWLDASTKGGGNE